MAVVAFAAIAFAAFSCDKPEPGYDSSDFCFEIAHTVTDYTEGSQFIKITSSGRWSLSVTDENGGSVDWIDFKTWSGAGNLKANIMMWEENTGDEDRICTITMTGSGSLKYVETFRQTSKTTDPSGGTIVSEKNPGWLEIPKMEDDGRYFITHDMVIGSSKTRNYSYYYDVGARLSVWVAYPLNRTLHSGSCGRTEAWNYDPKIPSSLQPTMYSGVNGYDRGHQIPSADRQIDQYNRQTYYFTNMTPQLGSLNQNGWANLEGQVRVWSDQFDTLYVVTGADIVGSYRTASDNKGNKITVPVGYFKALLGYKKGGTLGITGSTGGYTAIGFYYEHEGYSGGYMAKSMTIDELEKKTGFDFFPALDTRISAANAARVESTRDSWWK